MKKFNLFVVGVWFFLFAISIKPLGYGGLRANIIGDVNYFLWKYVTDATPRGTNGEPLAILDSATTQFFLRYEFVTFLSILIALNIAFYAGRGDLGRWLRGLVMYVSRKCRFARFKTSQRRAGTEFSDPERTSRQFY